MIHARVALANSRRAFGARELDSGRITLIVCVPLAGIIGFAAVLNPADLLISVLGLAFALVSLRSLSAGVSVFVVLVYLEQATNVGGVGIKLAGGVLALVWVIALSRNGRKTPFLLFDHPVLGAAAVLFFAWAFASMLWASEQEAARNGSLRILQGVLFAFIVYSAVRVWRDFILILAGVICGAVLTVGLGWVVKGGTAPDFNPYIESPVRLAGVVGEANSLAAFLLPALGVCMFGVGLLRSWPHKAAAVSVGAFLLIGLLLTGSRGGLVGLVIALGVALIVARQARRPLALIIVVLVTVAIGLSVVARLPSQVQRQVAFSERGGGGRIDIWSVALAIARDHPVVGIGTGNFPLLEPMYASGTLNLPEVRQIVDDRIVVHNTYLEVLTELGVVGLVIFSVLVLGAVATAFRALGDTGSDGCSHVNLLGQGLVAGVAGMLGAFFFMSGEYDKQLWLMLGLMVSYGSFPSTEGTRQRVKTRAVASQPRRGTAPRF